eukprot:TRINITY_DN22511_c0_g1_i1.p2 TRINITY_DN22511_c0_g1~~TRINITY_DN22511_c0_g1_i1.p2  ORF type:complete len:138 (-),score=3.56 TRINITY_DN22511_c0_g1_i1:339-752(-)
MFAVPGYLVPYLWAWAQGGANERQYGHRGTSAIEGLGRDTRDPPLVRPPPRPLDWACLANAFPVSIPSREYRTKHAPAPLLVPGTTHLGRPRHRLLHPLYTWPPNRVTAAASTFTAILAEPGDGTTRLLHASPARPF